MKKAAARRTAGICNNLPVSALGARSVKGGFSLIELIMTIVILGFSSLVLIPFFNSITRSPDPMIRQRGIALGQALMDEIIAKKWDENTPNGGGPICSTESGTGRGTAFYTLNCPEAVLNGSAIGAEGGESRIDYDDVDDYDNLLETNNFRDQNNVLFSLNGYQRTATVRYIASGSDPINATIPVGTTTAGATDTKRIAVTVTSPGQEQFFFVAVKCNF